MTHLDRTDERRVVLGSETDFALGGAAVAPSRKAFSFDGQEHVLEPRVMQVLVTLARANGGVVAREVLIERCWDGRIVGEHAVNRVIAQLRKLGHASGAFRVETITKVGYRLIAERDLAPLDQPRSLADAQGSTNVRRRSVLGRGVAAVAALGTAGSAATWLAVERRAHRPSAEALAFYRKGVEAQRQALAEQNRQAVVHFRNAVAADPEFADAWGALALSYRHLVEMSGGEDAEALATWSRSAAAEALRRDPDNADAQTALILLKPYFRNWSRLETELRDAIDRHPNAWLLHANLGRVLGETGRWSEAAAAFQTAIRQDAFLPFAWARLGVAFWSAGRLHEAETVFREAARRWPDHPSVWSTRFDFLTFAGRPDEALASAGGTRAAMPRSAVEEAVAVATALATRSPSAIGAALAKVAAGPANRAVLFLASVGRGNEAFARLQAYFRLDPGSPPLSPLARRYTDFLFMPPTAELRRDARFAVLATELGLPAAPARRTA